MRVGICRTQCSKRMKIIEEKVMNIICLGSFTHFIFIHLLFYFLNFIFLIVYLVYPTGLKLNILQLFPISYSVTIFPCQ